MPTAHEKAINKFIKHAEVAADRRTAKLRSRYITKIGADSQPYSHDMWNTYFHAAMNEMTIHAGLRCPKPKGLKQRSAV